MKPLDAPIDEIAPVNKPVWPVILKFGLIGGSIIIIYNLIAFKTSGVNVSTPDVSAVIIRFAVLAVLYISMMRLAVKVYRNKYANGFISFGRGVLIAFGTSMIMGIFNLLFVLLFLTVIDPDFSERAMRANLESSGFLRSHEIDNLVQDANILTIFYEAFLFGVGCVAGLILSLIISAVMKKERISTSLPIQK